VANAPVHGDVDVVGLSMHPGGHLTSAEVLSPGTSEAEVVGGAARAILGR